MQVTPLGLTRYITPLPSPTLSQISIPYPCASSIPPFGLPQYITPLLSTSPPPSPSPMLYTSIPLLSTVCEERVLESLQRSCESSLKRSARLLSESLGYVQENSVESGGQVVIMSE